MSSNANPHHRKRITNRRERNPTRPARTEGPDDEKSPADHKPVGELGGLIEIASKDDPGAAHRPANQEEPPRAPGP